MEDDRVTVFTQYLQTQKQVRLNIPEYEFWTIICALSNSARENEAAGFSATADSERALLAVLLESNPHLKNA